MNFKNKLFDIHEFYNLSRYLFLNIEWNYNNSVEKTGITLPQLRVLWIIKIFQDISLGEIARTGYWSSPTVTKMLKLLMEKELVVREETLNKKIYSLNVTEKGNKIIELNSMKKSCDSAFVKLLPDAKKMKLDFIIDIFRSIAEKSGSSFIFQYIDKINASGLKIDFSAFDFEDKDKLKELVCFYNLLRIFILTIENRHRKLLSPFNLTYPQLRALWIIDAFSGITSNKLSRLAFWAPSTANFIVKNLYEKGFIYKEKSQLKNSLYLYVSESGEELLVKDFKINQNSLLIYKDIKFLTVEDLTELNNALQIMNKILKNDFVEEYIKKTFAVIEKRLLI